MNNPVVVIGDGGHSRVVASALRLLDREIIGFTSKSAQYGEADDSKVRIFSDELVMKRFSPKEIELVLGVGSVSPNTEAGSLQTIVRLFQASGFQFAGFVHPTAFVAEEASIAATAQIHAGAIVQAGATIGPFAIVNTGTIVDHDCEVGAFCHLAPGTVLSGNVKIGVGCHLGTGCRAIQGIHIGAYSFVAAGAVIAQSIEDGVWVKGVPAKPFLPKE